MSNVPFWSVLCTNAGLFLTLHALAPACAHVLNVGLCPSGNLWQTRTLMPGPQHGAHTHPVVGVAAVHTAQSMSML